MAHTPFGHRIGCRGAPTRQGKNVYGHYLLATPPAPYRRIRHPRCTCASPTPWTRAGQRGRDDCRSMERGRDMARPLTVTWNRWSDFVRFDVEVLQHGSVFRPSFLFRGQSDASWTLRPTLARIGQEAGWTVERALEIEDDLVKHFITLAHLHLPAKLVSDPRHVATWWILIQHYGAPTRILDWTRSIYVAAYFAVQEQPRKDGAVWMVNLSSLQDEMD